MNNDDSPFKIRIRESGRKDVELAQAVIDGLRERGAEPKRDARSLTQEFRRLKKGEDSWWANNRDALEVLAEVLGCEPSDILPGLQDVDAGGFPEFPSLRPLGQDEPPFRYGDLRPSPSAWRAGVVPQRAGREGGTSRRRLFEPPQPGCWWIQAAAGTGKSLAVRRLADLAIPRTSGGGTPPARLRTMSVDSLQAAVRFREHGGPLLVEVATPDPETDTAALRDFAGHRWVTVMARFELPVQLSPWETLVWSPNPGTERRALLEWIAARTPQESLLDVEDLLAWIEKRDRDGRLFVAPRDLLFLAALAHEGGPRRLSTAAASWDARMLDPDHGLGPDALARLRIDLASARLTDLALPASGGLTAEKWAALVPSATATSLTVGEQEVDQAFSGVSDGTTSLDEVRRRVLDLVTRPVGPEDTVRAARKAGLLSTTTNGGLEMEPEWYRVDTVARTIRAALEGAPRGWGRWCIAADRRADVERALATLSWSELIRLAEKATGAWRPDDPATIAAVEAMTHAVAVALTDGRGQTVEAEAEPALQGLWHCQWATVRRFPGDHPAAPLFRDRNTIDPWVGTCWAFSLRVRRPAGIEIQEQDTWLLPGWVGENLSIRSAPRWVSWLVGVPLPSLPLNRPDDEVSDVAQRVISHPGASMLLTLAVEVAAKCDLSESDSTPVALLADRILLVAHSTDGPLTSKADIDSLAGGSWTAWYLHRRAEQGGPDAIRAVGQHLWRSSIGAGSSLGEMARRAAENPELTVLLHAGLEVEWFRAALRADPKKLESLLRYQGDWFPPLFQAELILAVIEQDPTGGAFLDRRWAESPTLRMTHVWERALAHPNATWSVAQHFWANDPERAAALLLGLAHDDPRVDLLLNTGIRWSHFAIERLESCPVDCPHRAPNRLANHLASRPDLVDRIFPMLMAAPKLAT